MTQDVLADLFRSWMQAATGDVVLAVLSLAAIAILILIHRGR